MSKWSFSFEFVLLLNFSKLISILIPLWWWLRVVKIFRAPLWIWRRNSFFKPITSSRSFLLFWWSHNFRCWSFGSRWFIETSARGNWWTPTVIKLYFSHTQMLKGRWQELKFKRMAKGEGDAEISLSATNYLNTHFLRAIDHTYKGFAATPH